jgi:hypothetical protein
MVEIDEELKPLSNDVMRPMALDVGDKADTAGIMLVLRVVKPLPRKSWLFF